MVRFTRNLQKTAALVHDLNQSFDTASEYASSDSSTRSYIWAEAADDVKKEEVDDKNAIKKGSKYIPVAEQLPGEFINSDSIYQEIRDLKCIMCSLAQRLERIQFKFENTEIGMYDFVVVSNGNHKGVRGHIVEVSETGKSLWVLPENATERFLKRRGNLRKLVK